MKYSEEVKKRIDEIQLEVNSVKKMDKLLKFVRPVIPKNAESAVYVYSRDINIYFNAKSMTEVKDLLRAFAKIGVMVNHAYDLDTNPNWYLSKEGYYGQVYLKPRFARDNEEGATCRIVEVGEEQVTTTRKIYKLVCDDNVSAPENVDERQSA